MIHLADEAGETQVLRLTTSLREQLQSDLGASYTIEREIGRGGMATVFLARDSRHERNVAVKVLDPELAASVGADRFLAEIRTTALLQHPNILPLFDSGVAGGLLYYVMPYLPGETLRGLIERERQLPVPEAVRIASGIAAALDHAHRHGIVHRDLKPENILLADGEPVVADFGIALALDRARSERFTLTGLSLGTPEYMSPEQATGERLVDARSDIFALGCIVYEMLTGETPFTAATAQATIARIITETPRAITRGSVTPHIQAAVATALEKLPADRWRSAKEFADALNGGRTLPTNLRGQRRNVERALALGWIPLLAAVAFLLYRQRPAVSSPDVTLRFPIVVRDTDASSGTTPGIPFAISGDDRRAAFIGGSLPAHNNHVVVHALDQDRLTPLTGTTGALQPTFSPDGKWIAFALEGRIARIPTEGGEVATVYPTQLPTAGFEWQKGDSLLASIGGSVTMVPVSGGDPVVLATADTARGESAMWGPHRINDRFAAYVSVSPAGMASSKISTIDLRARTRKISAYTGTTVLGAIDDRVVWVTSTGTVMAARIAGDGSLGSATRLLEDVLVRPGGAAKATLSRNGSLMYQRGLLTSRLVMVDQHGAVRVLPAPEKAYSHPRLSPDGSRIAVAVSYPGGSDVWVIDVKTGSGSALTGGGAAYEVPEWTADGKGIVVRASRGAGTSLELIHIADRSVERLAPNAIDVYSGALSPDGAWVVYRTGDLNDAQRRTIWVQRRDGSGDRRFNSPQHESFDNQVSPDGRFLAYMSTVGGLAEVYVQPFPGPGEPVQISVGGGREPSWSRDMRTIYYRNGSAMMSAAISTKGSVSVSSRTQLFAGSFLFDPSLRDYDIAPDGRSFLMLQAVDEQAAPTFVYGWANEVRRIVK